jgi:hypothetical protein
VILSTPARERIEAEIEKHLSAADALIALLDRADGDPDLCASEHDGREPDADDEPSLGWTISGNWGGRDDLEDDHESTGRAL